MTRDIVQTRARRGAHIVPEVRNALAWAQHQGIDRQADPSSDLTLVLLRRIDGELSDELVLLIEEAHLRPGHHQDHPTAFVGASDAEMEEATAVAQGDLSRGVDLVMADPVALARRLRASEGQP